MNGREFKSWLTEKPARPLVMGILNVTPDSFSDGGNFISVENAVAHAQLMINEGADILDVGGESTRPGAARVSASGQIGRIIPVIAAVRRQCDVAISVDTTLGSVAEAAADAGAAILNDVSAGREDPMMLTIAAKRQLPIILMHMQGEPGTMQDNPTYADVTREVSDFLAGRVRAAMQAGVPREHILIDPGIGFGKTTEHNLTLLRELGKLAAIGHRILVGTSRKRFVGAITGVTSPGDRIYGSVASALMAIMNGANIVRVHDVGPTIQAIRIAQAIESA